MKPLDPVNPYVDHAGEARNCVCGCGCFDELQASDRLPDLVIEYEM